SPPTSTRPASRPANQRPPPSATSAIPGPSSHSTGTAPAPPQAPRACEPPPQRPPPWRPSRRPAFPSSPAATTAAGLPATAGTASGSLSSTPIPPRRNDAPGDLPPPLARRRRNHRRPPPSLGRTAPGRPRGDAGTRESIGSSRGMQPVTRPDLSGAHEDGSVEP